MVCGMWVLRVKIMWVVDFEDQKLVGCGLSGNLWDVEFMDFLQFFQCILY